MAILSTRAEEKRNQPSLYRKAALTGAAFTVLLSCSVPAPALALFSSKKNSLQLPVNDKIELETIELDADSSTSADEDKKTESAEASDLKPIDLSPLKLGSENE